MMNPTGGLPPQQIPMSKKTLEWRKKHLDWALTKSFFNYSAVRKSVVHKRINYDLMDGKLHMDDVLSIVNPENVKAGYIPDKIQHYPIINSKINVLRGEESKRLFDFKVVITNPEAISMIEANKKKELMSQLQLVISNQDLEEDEFEKELERINKYINYEWQDLREIRANALLNHYHKELDFNMIFNAGFYDALTVAEEIYQCDIVGGEPVLYRLNPNKVRVFKSGFSNRVEDADIIVIEDYWQPGRIIDAYYENLKPKQMQDLENLTMNIGSRDSMDNYDERDSFVYNDGKSDTEYFFDPTGAYSGEVAGLNQYYDAQGNIRVLKMFWKSRRKIKKVTSFDPQTGEEVINFHTEHYLINPSLGETEETFWINEAWEGVKIGKDIYVNMRPRPVQYNRLSNPSRCHFGIVGSIYSMNERRPFSLVDMMKPYNYLYNVIHDRLNKSIAANLGKILELDLATVPKGWEVDKWMYYARVHKLAVKDSFKEGNIGAATGKLAGGFANASRGVIDGETGNHIQQYVNLLEFIKMEMSEVAGISRLREGLVSNRETVGGVERATLQSSHITEWLFLTHDNVKKRVLECFLETCKIAMKGTNKKFLYILSDASQKIIDIDGDEFSECDYGLAVDVSQSAQTLNQKLDMLAQAALQNQTLSFSAIMKLYNSSSLAEKQRMIEADEQAIQLRQAEQAQRNSEMQQAAMEQEAMMRQAEMEQQERIADKNNETKIIIAAMGKDNLIEVEDGVDTSGLDREKLLENIRQFDTKMRLERDKFNQLKVTDREKIALDKKKVAKQNKPSTK